MLQIICSCGRIAEVRHKKVGKKLAFTHCDECGVDLGSAKKAAVIESKAKVDIGIKGEFLKQTNETDSLESENVLKDFEPEPEFLESDIETETDSAPVKSNGALKIVFGVLFAAVLGGGAYQLNKVKG